MLLIQEKSNGQRRAEIFMRPDGLFEGRIYQADPEADCGHSPHDKRFICGVTETLKRVESLVDEELGL